MALDEYNRKRDFGRTREPEGRAPKAARDGQTFVVQLHHASARHYDFRLEVDGVLRSWAVPKGPSLRPGEKRLAVEVEDHPLHYAAFEGTIPQGAYGAGHVATFDTGHWAPSGDAAAALAAGRLEFELFGERLRGAWNLVRTRRAAGKPQWLLIKRTDAHAADLEADDLLDGIAAPPEDAPGASTAKGLRIRAQHATARGASKSPAGRATTSRTGRAQAQDRADSVEVARAPHAGAARSRMRPPRPLLKAARTLARGQRLAADADVQPMLTTAADVAPDGDDWLHEWKWDGYRAITRAGAAARILTRNGLDWSARFPEILHALRSLGADAVLDGEIIAVDAHGRSSFNDLQRALEARDTAQLRYCVFDLLALEGDDLRGAPLVKRKALLERLLVDADPRLFYSGHVQGDGPARFEAARARGTEGIISKRADSAYVAARSADWLKIKVVETCDLVIVGYTDPKGARQGLGALLLAQRRRGALAYVGRVGSGLDQALLQDLPPRLQALAVDAAPVELPPAVSRAAADVHWVRPEIVAEVRFRGWSREGLLRQATLHRVRDDKPADEDSDAERAGGASATVASGDAASSRRARVSKQATATGARAAPAATARKASRRRAAASADLAAIPAPSSPGRVVFPDAGYTKQDVHDYYLSVADRLVPEIAGRLLSVVRCPQGIQGQRFFQKHAGPGFGEAVRRVPIVENDGDHATYFCIDDVEGLMALVQMNTIELHPWGSTVDDLERPDRVIFDLDPDEGIAWNDVKAAARDVRDRLADAGLPSYPKLTGGKGVHVVAPLKREADWARVRDFSEAFANAMSRQQPARFVATMSKAKREGRIFIDWLRNGRGATAIATWSLRARPGAPASVPLTWDELTRVREAGRYSLANAAARTTPAFIDALIRNAPPLPSHD